MIKPITALLVSVFLLPLSASAAEEADLETLAQEPRWQALMHINQGTTWRFQGRSYVDDPDYFLHEKGATDPVAELRASVDQLQPSDSEARCDYPARYRFLRQHLDWSEESGLSHCEEYQEWREHMPNERVALIFPASYLNSPSSMFGHTLLRVDTGEDEDGVWLSRAINFGATTGEDDNSMLYIYRGLFGGYPGRFTNVPYVNKIQDYAHLENRDMWEYELNLNEEERAWLIEHLWELRDVEFDYLFLDENCSFRLLELIDLARPGTDIMSDFRLTEVPVDTVRTLDQSDFIEGSTYRPSKSRELEALSGTLNADQQRLALALANDPDVADSEAFQSLPESEQHQVARTAYEYLRLDHREGPRDRKAAGNSFALLQLINRTEGEGRPEIPEPDAPERGHGTKLLSAGGGFIGEQEFGELQYRFTYHDWFDAPEGFLEGAAIEAFNTRIRKTAGQDLQLEQLDVVNIQSLATRTRFRSPVSWFVNGGLDRRYIGEKRHLTRQIQGGPGVSWRFGNFIPYAFATARAENNSAHNPLVSTAAGARTGILWYGNGFQFGVETQGYYFHNDDRRHRSSATLNVPLATHHALRATVERDGGRGRAETEFRLQWRYYFD